MKAVSERHRLHGEAPRCLLLALVANSAFRYCPLPTAYCLLSTCGGRISSSTLIVASRGTVAARKNAG